MENLRLRDRFKNLLGFALKKEQKNLEVVEERTVDPEHGFQLIKDDYGEYLRRFLPPDIFKNRIINLNEIGYMGVETGLGLKSLIDNPEYDTYIKSVHSTQVDSIMDEGIRCLGTTSSLATINPDTIDEVNLENTITKTDDLTMLVEVVKKNNGVSQGGNDVDGTMILQIPKGMPKEEILYYNTDTNTFNIHPNYIVGFLPVDKNHIVGDWVLPNKKIEENKTM